MPRALTVGNGNILVNLDSYMRVRDFYYPFVGQQNHVGGHVHKWGVWVDGDFVWSSDSGWKTSMKYKKDKLVTQVHMTHQKLSLSITIEDFVHYESNIFIRKFIVNNQRNHSREVRLFFHQDYHMYQDDVGDTVCFVPKRNAMVHYKRKRYMLFAGLSEDGHGIKQYTTGQKDWTHKQGTWSDAEDGELDMNAISQGAVDSTVRFDLNIDAKESKSLYYWTIVGNNFDDVFRKHDALLAQTPQHYQTDTENYWASWVNKQELDFADLDETLVDLYKTSLLIVRTQTDNRGAITAANDSDNLHYNKDSYSYVWPRDGAFVSLALDRAGYHEVTRRFFSFCQKVLSPPGYLLHKFNPDGSVGSSWHPWVIGNKPSDPIQEDETALVLYALWKHYELTKNLEFVKPLYENMVVKMGDFLSRYRNPHTHLPNPSYDLWEEQHGIFTFTTATVIAALRAASKFAELFGDTKRKDLYLRVSEDTKQALVSRLFDKDHNRFAKKAVFVDGKLELDMTIDSSVFALYALGVLDAADPKVNTTMLAVKHQLEINGGIARYENDFYHRKEGFNGPGNPWIICTLWLADWYIAKATTHVELALAVHIMNWVAHHANEAGILPEQVEPDTGKPLSVSPLTWSHSSYVNTVLNYIEKFKKLSEDRENGFGD